ncbi:MAG TPA: hypothetical protein VMB50_03480 [Myxococcales bacterium]|nr:hypothetical protein [Myxococcales bacterium]
MIRATRWAGLLAGCTGCLLPALVASAPDAGAGSSGGGGSSSGGQVGPTCAADAGGPGFSCATDADCACGNGCALVPGGFGSRACALACRQTGDCPDPATSCAGGTCQPTPCGGDGGAGESPYGPCEVQAPADGTCDRSGRCVQSGTAQPAEPCGVAATRSQPGQLCATGSACFAPPGASQGTCRQVCSSTAATDSCAPGTLCVGVDFGYDGYGACEPAQGGASACAPGVANELWPCGPSSGCGCLPGAAVACVADPTLEALLYDPDLALPNPYGSDTFCERACASAADCPLPYTTCLGSRCTYDLCGSPGTGEGFGLPCDAGAATGLCTPVYESHGVTGPGFGLCLLGGTLPDEAPCSPAAQNRADPATLCATGDLCLPQGDAGLCFALWPTSVAESTGAPCADGYGGVFGLVPGVAVCCGASGDPCAVPHDCCSAQCAQGACL